MEITPVRDVYNPILKRREVTFFADHSIAATPKLYDIKKLVAAKYKADEGLVFVRSLKTLTGTTKAVGEAEVYDSLESAKSLVPKHIATRNLPERHKTKEDVGKVTKPSKKNTAPKKE
jgi:ribosomal protein S24E